jgi:TrmH family RNA methyltransferase
MVERITSRQNPAIRRVRAIAAGDPAGAGTILLDGIHLVSAALAAHHPLELAIVASDDGATPSDEVRALVTALTAVGTRILGVPRRLMDAVSPVRSASPIVALAPAPGWNLENLTRPPPALALVLVDVQDPGNVGAVVRAADAAGATGVCAAGASADPLGWKALRGAMGSALRLPVVRVPGVAAACDALARQGLTLVATTPGADASLYDCDLTSPVAVLLGSEGRGLPDAALELAARRVAIPMREGVESLNVAVAAALVAYEARRQRVGSRSMARRE